MIDTPPREYLDDDRNDPLQALRIFRDDQGDLYVSVGAPEDKIHHHCVRLCASGGNNSELFVAMQRAYEAMRPAGAARRSGRAP